MELGQMSCQPRLWLCCVQGMSCNRKLEEIITSRVVRFDLCAQG